MAIHKYAYGAPSLGFYRIEGKDHKLGKNLQTLAGYRQYRSIGFDTLSIDDSPWEAYRGEPFATSHLKHEMDLAKAVGLSRVIVYDARIYELSFATTGLVGAGKKFSSEQALEDYLRDCIKDYSRHPLFAGVKVRDEPSEAYFLPISEIVKAFQRIDPHLYVHCNLLPLMGGLSSLYDRRADSDSNEDLEIHYRHYLEMFCQMVPLMNLSVDDYPFRATPEEGKSILFRYFTCLEIFAEVAKKYGRETTFVIQTSSMFYHDFLAITQVGEKEIRYQYNCCLAFGIHSIVAWTYSRYFFNSHEGEYYPDDSAMIFTDGEKTERYDALKRVIEENAPFESIYSPFQYDDSYILGERTFLQNVKRTPFPEMKVLSSTPLLVSRLLDSSNGRALYALVSLEDPSKETDDGMISVSFPNDANVDCYYKGKKNNQFFTARQGKCVLLPGEAVFLLMDASKREKENV